MLCFVVVTETIKDYPGIRCDAESITSISVTWPDRDRSVDTFPSPPLDSVLRIRQGEPAWTLVQLDTLRLKGGGHTVHRGDHE